MCLMSSTHWPMFLNLPGICNILSLQTVKVFISIYDLTMHLRNVGSSASMVLHSHVFLILCTCLKYNRVYHLCSNPWDMLSKWVAFQDNISGDRSNNLSFHTSQQWLFNQWEMTILLVLWFDWTRTSKCALYYREGAGSRLSVGHDQVHDQWQGRVGV